ARPVPDVATHLKIRQKSANGQPNIRGRDVMMQRMPTGRRPKVKPPPDDEVLAAPRVGDETAFAAPLGTRPREMPRAARPVTGAEPIRGVPDVEEFARACLAPAGDRRVGVEL